MTVNGQSTTDDIDKVYDINKLISIVAELRAEQAKSTDTIAELRAELAKVKGGLIVHCCQLISHIKLKVHVSCITVILYLKVCMY